MVAATPNHITLVSMNRDVKGKKKRSSLVVSLSSAEPLLVKSNEYSSSQQVSISSTGSNNSTREYEQHQQLETKLGPDFEPGCFDVICAKGKEAREHTGNRRFRLLIDMNLEKYRAAKSKIAKSSIVTDIVDAIRTSSPGGGFIKQSEGTWYQVSDHHAREKVGQSFRDRLHTEYKSSSKAKIKKRKLMEEESLVRFPLPFTPTSSTSSHPTSTTGINNDDVFGGSKMGDHQGKSCLPQNNVLPPSRLNMRPTTQSYERPWTNRLAMNSLPNPLQLSMNMALSQERDFALERLSSQRYGGGGPLSAANSSRFPNADFMMNNLMANGQHNLSPLMDFKMDRQMMATNDHHLSFDSKVRELSRKDLHDDSILLGVRQPMTFSEQIPSAATMDHHHFGSPSAGFNNSGIFRDSGSALTGLHQATAASSTSASQLFNTMPMKRRNSVVMNMTNNSSSNLTRDQQEASLNLLTFSAGLGASSQSSSFSKEFMEDQQKFLTVEPQKGDPHVEESRMNDNNEDDDDDVSKQQQEESS